MTWLSLQDAFGKREISPEDREAVEDVLDAAEAWRDGEMPTDVALRIGTAVTIRSKLPSPSWTRWLAIRSTDTSDPRREALLLLIDRAIEMRGLVVTDFGVIGKAELADSDRQVEAFHRRMCSENIHG